MQYIIWEGTNGINNITVTTDKIEIWIRLDKCVIKFPELDNYYIREYSFILRNYLQKY